MAVIKFPDPKRAPADGLLALGGDLEPETLLAAYAQGIFPWPVTFADEAPELAWFSPDPRAILGFDDLHVPRSLERAARAFERCGGRLSLDHAFTQVIRACAMAPRPGQKGTWITEEMISAYIELHRLGHAHSVEAWIEEELVGGIYGVDAGGVFAGESMFHRYPNASKLALLRLIGHLRAAGSEWMDIQMLTPHMKALGASEISRDDFLRRLSRTRARALRLFAASPARP